MRSISNTCMLCRIPQPSWAQFHLKKPHFHKKTKIFMCLHTHTQKIPYLFTHFLKTQICMPWYDLKKAVFNNASPAISSFKIQHDITKQKDICRLVKSYFYCPENQNINYLKIGPPFFPTDPFLLCKFLPNIAACQNLCLQSI